MDVQEYRQALHDRWSRSAATWAHRRERVQRMAMPVSRWMLDAIEPQPGHVVLELAAGPGDTGLLAAELVAPAGRVISSDFVEEMLDTARDRAAELGIDNVEFRVLDIESLDLDAASVDAVLCRWGYMFAADPGAALRETRRVLRPGGRLALAVWDERERNPWATAPTDELVESGLVPPPDPSLPTMFSLAPAARLRGLLEDAGFTEIDVDAVDVENRYAGIDDYWELTHDLARPFADAVDRLDADQRERVRRGMAERLARWRQDDGTLVVPGRTLVAAATA